jgi:hypothetical protein
MTPQDMADWQLVLDRRWQHLDDLETDRQTVLESIDEIAELISDAVELEAMTDRSQRDQGDETDDS